MLIDLDRFKNINNSLGHDVGDQVIIEIGRRLSRNACDGCTVARLGGDELVVILANIGQEEEVAQLAQQVLLTLAEPLIVNGQELYPGESIGISLYPKDGNDAPSLLRGADMTMYQAKERGGNNFQFYAHDMNARELERLQLEARLRQAIDHNEFVLHYQPQVDIAQEGSSEWKRGYVGSHRMVRWLCQTISFLSPKKLG